MTPEATWDPHSEDFSTNEDLADGRSERTISSLATIVSSIYLAKTNKLANPIMSPASLLDSVDFSQLVKGTAAVSATRTGR
jgi:hypothetical protein